MAVTGTPATAGTAGTETATVKSMPVPVKDSICVVPAAPPESSVIVSVPARAFTAAGVNVSMMSQLASAATVDPFVHVVPVAAIAKSAAFAPLIASVARCNVDPPELVSVTLVAALAVPTP